MSTLPHCWRTGIAAALSAVLLAACGTTPGPAPDRRGFPGEAARAELEGERGDILNDAPVILEATADPELFAATRAALAAGDWMRATLALPRAATPDTDAVDPTAPVASQPIPLWIDYYGARIALQRGDLEAHDAMINALRSRPLPEDLYRELLLHELRLATAKGNAGRELESSLRLLRAGGHPDVAPIALQDSAWRAVQRLSAAEIRDLRPRGDEGLRGWLDLASANDSPTAPDAAASINAWLAQYPQHPAAARAAALQDAALRDSGTSQLTLLLPLSGPLEKAGDAVSRGFIAAYFADRERNLSLDIIDSRRYEDVNDAYAAARERGAGIVVGPLGKRQVEALLARSELPVPVLSLNRPEQALTNAGVLQLSLAPEDEARQLAEDAFTEGARRALLIRPEGSWGERMESAFRERWESLGGRLPSAALYSQPSSYSDSLRDALGLDASAERSTEVRSLFASRVETSGRRREDLNAVFLLSKSSDEARALKPLINYHYAGDLPVYALSTADTGTDDPSLNGDLGGLRLLSMPWRLDNSQVPGRDDSTGSSFAALHALGADAYALARRWWRMRSAAAPLYPGLTAELHARDDGTLERRLDMAEFDRGTLRPR